MGGENPLPAQGQASCLQLIAYVTACLRAHRKVFPHVGYVLSYSEIMERSWSVLRTLQDATHRLAVFYEFGNRGDQIIGLKPKITVKHQIFWL